jgi:hypothetical protein
LAPAFTGNICHLIDNLACINIGKLDRICSPAFRRLGLGRLPGDIVIERENMTFYFPVMTCLLVSALLSLVFWVVNR